MQTLGTAFRTDERTPEQYEADVLSEREAAYRREHDMYVRAGKTERAAAVVAAALAELDVDISATPDDDQVDDDDVDGEAVPRARRRKPSAIPAE